MGERSAHGVAGPATRYGDSWNILSTAALMVLASMVPFRTPLATPAHADRTDFANAIRPGVTEVDLVAQRQARQGSHVLIMSCF